MDLYDARPLKLSTVEKLNDRWNPREPNQFFWLDDGFGATQYEHAAADAWNRSTPSIAAALRRGARLVVTSRDYVHAAARHDLKVSAFPLLEEASVVIEVEAFTREEWEQILYNHLRLGTEDAETLASMRSDQRISKPSPPMRAFSLSLRAGSETRAAASVKEHGAPVSITS
jgi:hypothetical protein